MITHVRIQLTRAEMEFAVGVGVQRSMDDIFAGCRDTYNLKVGMGWQCSIEGALGEQAVAKLLGVHWDGSIGNFAAKDVGAYQVRATARLDGRLILHPGDADDDKWILVRGEAPNLIVGPWCYGREGKLQADWSDPGKNGRPAFFVPRGIMRDIDSLTAAPGDPAGSSAPRSSQSQLFDDDFAGVTRDDIIP